MVTIPTKTLVSLLYGVGTSSAVWNCLNMKLRCNEKKKKQIKRVYIKNIKQGACNYRVCMEHCTKIFV